MQNQRKQRQTNRNLGESYQTKTGKIVEKRKIQRLQQCKKRCSSDVSYEDQTRIFNSYWSQGEYIRRVNFVQNLVTVKQKKEVRKGKGKLRKYSVEYRLNAESQSVTVCQKCFLSTLGETESFVKNVVKKRWLQMNQSTTREQRGRHIPVNKSSPLKIKEIENHINKFPAYESHYARSHTSKKYLPPGLNVSIMYNLYKQEVRAPLSIKMYRKVFITTGLKFKSPQIDTCSKCDQFTTLLRYEIDAEKRSKIEAEKDAHQKNAELAYQSKKQDKETAAKSKGSQVLLTFDLQQCLPTPLLKTSIAFYKRQLWVFNLTINDSQSNTACYMWHEAIAKRGGNEIASCIYKHLNTINPAVKHVIMYSDCCPGQNKNKIVAGMLSALLEYHSTLEIVDHKFLESGHTHMECDSDHAVIEKAKKSYSTSVHHPNDWYELVRQAKRTKPFEVTEMTQDVIYNFDKLYTTSFTMRSQDVDKNKFLWAEVKWVRYQKNEQGILYYKKSLSEDEAFLKLNIRKRGKSKFKLDNVLEKCYNDTLPISKEKKKDLLDLLHLMRPDVREFYEHLPDDASTPTIDYDIEDLCANDTQAEISNATLESHDESISQSEISDATLGSHNEGIIGDQQLLITNETGNKSEKFKKSKKKLPTSVNEDHSKNKKLKQEKREPLKDISIVNSNNKNIEKLPPRRSSRSAKKMSNDFVYY